MFNTIWAACTLRAGVFATKNVLSYSAHTENPPWKPPAWHFVRFHSQRRTARTSVCCQKHLVAFSTTMAHSERTGRIGRVGLKIVCQSHCNWVHAGLVSTEWNCSHHVSANKQHIFYVSQAQQPRSIQRQWRMRMRRPQTMKRRPRKLFRAFCRRWSTLLQGVSCALNKMFWAWVSRFIDMFVIQVLWELFS